MMYHQQILLCLPTLRVATSHEVTCGFSASQGPMLILCVLNLMPRQKGRQFSDGNFKYIFLNENIWISFKISLKFVTKSSINNIPALVQIMAWRRPGRAKPLSEPTMIISLTHMCVTRLQWVKNKYGYICVVINSRHCDGAGILHINIMVADDLVTQRPRVFSTISLT